MAKRSDMLASNLEELQQDLTDLWRTLTRDPAKEARKERAWTILAGVFTAVGAIVARKAAGKVWGILTGEVAPIVKQAPPAPTGGPSTRRSETEVEAKTEAETEISHA
jgi:Protein of unknown function (DUF4235)